MVTTLTTRTATWSNIGTSVEECNNNIDAILAKSGLDYDVIEQPVYIGENKDSAEKFKAIVRNSDGHIYNIAKSSYTICQNREAFSFLESMPDTLQILKAGETPSGMIYMIGVLPTIQVLGDDFKPHLIFQTSHNSDFALKTAIAPLRIVCQNQFNTAFGDNNNSITIRHTPGIATQIGEAGRVMADTLTYMADFAQKAELLATNHINVDRAINILFPISKDATEFQANRVEEIRNLFRSIYSNEDNQNFKGTAWGLLNAVTDYTTHYTGSRSTPESRFVSSIAYPEFQRKAIHLINSGELAA